MSKRGGRQATKVCNEDYDDGDDFYDEDDYDYEDYDDHDDYVASPKPAPKPPTQPPVLPQKAPTSPVAVDLSAEVDGAILAGALAALRLLLPAVGAQRSVAELIAPLRASNYDAPAAARILLAASPAPHVTIETSGGGAARKKLVFSGPSSKASPAPGSSKKGDDTLTPVGSLMGMNSPLPSIDAFAPAPQALPAAPIEDRSGAAVVDQDGREALGVVIAGHVDTGKSTLLGHLLVQLGCINPRDVTKFEQQCKQRGKASFHYAWILDQSEEERRRGVTIDAGVQYFATSKRRIAVLDAPGHKDYVQAMVSSSTQADAALFVVSASVGEFESGLENMTMEHMRVLRALGVGSIIVIVNKMDTVGYAEDRYKECCTAVEQLHDAIEKQVVKESVMVAGVSGTVNGAKLAFIPASGFQGINLTKQASVEMPWYAGPTVVEILNNVPPRPRLTKYPLRLLVGDCVKQLVSARLEAGNVAVGDSLVFVPGNVKATVKSIDRAGERVKDATAGDVVDVTLSGDLVGLVSGAVGCPPKKQCGTSTLFEARLQAFPCLQRVILPGTKLHLQVHNVSAEATVVKLLRKMNAETGQWSPEGRLVKCLASDTVGLVVLKMPYSLALERAVDCRPLGNFVLLQDGNVVGGGLVEKLLQDK